MFCSSKLNRFERRNLRTLEPSKKTKSYRASEYCRMKIAIIGIVYVGLVASVCFSDLGHEVVCVDKDHFKIETLSSGNVPVYVPGLNELMFRIYEAGRIRFTGDLHKAVAGVDTEFIAVGTKQRRCAAMALLI